MPSPTKKTKTNPSSTSKTPPTPTKTRSAPKKAPRKKAVQDLTVPKPMPLAKSKGTEVLNKAFTADNSNGMYFQDMAAADAATDTIFTAPANDPTIPLTPEADRSAVTKLLASIKNMDKALDKGKNYRHRLEPGHKVSYSEWMIEKCAWELLRVLKSIHLNGFTAPIYDTETLRYIGQTAAWTFEERMGMVCRMLEISKYVAVTLMKSEKTWTYIGAPHRCYQSSITNSNSNRERAGYIVEGRENARKRKSEEMNEADGDEEEREEREAAVDEPGASTSLDDVVGSTGLNRDAAQALLGINVLK